MSDINRLDSIQTKTDNQAEHKFEDALADNLANSQVVTSIETPPETPAQPLKKSVDTLARTKTTAQRQTSFNSLARKFGNSYANQLANNLKEVKTAKPGELDNYNNHDFGKKEDLKHIDGLKSTQTLQRIPTPDLASTTLKTTHEPSTKSGKEVTDQPLQANPAHTKTNKAEQVFQNQKKEGPSQETVGYTISGQEADTTKGEYEPSVSTIIGGEHKAGVIHNTPPIATKTPHDPIAKTDIAGFGSQKPTISQALAILNNITGQKNRQQYIKHLQLKYGNEFTNQLIDVHLNSKNSENSPTTKSNSDNQARFPTLGEVIQTGQIQPHKSGSTVSEKSQETHTTSEPTPEPIDLSDKLSTGENKPANQTTAATTGPAHITQPQLTPNLLHTTTTASGKPEHTILKVDQPQTNRAFKQPTLAKPATTKAQSPATSPKKAAQQASPKAKAGFQPTGAAHHSTTPAQAANLSAKVGVNPVEVVNDERPTPAINDLTVPTTNHQGTKLLVEQVNGAAKTARQTFAAQLAQETASITAAIAQQKQALLQAGATQRQSLAGIFSGARAELEQFFTTAHAKLEERSATEKAAVAQWHTTAQGNAQKAFTKVQSDAHNLGDTHAGKAVEVANTSAQQAQTQLQGSADQARQIGNQKAGVGGINGDVAQANAKAAHDISGDTAKKVEGGVGDLVSQLQSTGPKVAEEYRKQAQDAATQLGGGLNQVVSQLTSFRQNAATTIQQLVTTGMQALTTAKTQLTTSLDQIEHNLQNQLETQLNQKIHETEVAGQKALATFRQQGQQAQQAGDHQVNQFVAKASGMAVSVKEAQQVGGEATGQIHSAYAGLNGQVQSAAQQTIAALQQSTSQATTALNGLSTTAHTQVQSLLSRAKSQVDQQTAQLTTQLGDTTKNVTKSGDDMLNQVTTNLNEQITKLNEGFEKGHSEHKNTLDSKISEAQTKANEPVNTLPGRVDQAQAKINQEAAKAEERKSKPWWEQAADWVGDQLGQFFEMLKDPGFVAGLVVGLLLTVGFVVLTIVTGGLDLAVAVAIVAAIGAISAGVGTVVDNVAQKGWSHWSDNLLQNMAIGAVFGAGLALIPESIGVVGGLLLTEGATVALTIISNKINNQPWDHGLLANMLITGLLFGVGRVFGKFLEKSGIGDKGNTGSTDPYADLQTKYSIDQTLVDQLKAKNVSPQSIENLINQGIPANEAVKIGNFGPSNVQIAESLLSRGLTAKQATVIASDAGSLESKYPGIIQDVRTLAESGNLDNPAQLQTVLNRIAGGDKGFVQQLHDAAERAGNGDKVSVENGQADVVDYTAKEAIQHKQVVGKALAFFARLKDAAAQLRGDGGEVPPPGFRRIADIRITNPDNPFYGADEAELRVVLKNTNSDGKLNGVDEIIITNATGRHTFNPPF